MECSTRRSGARRRGAPTWWSTPQASGELTVAALRAIGHPGVSETTIGVDIGYSTATFHIPGSAPTHWKDVLHLPLAPQTSRAGLMIPIEGRRWMLALGGRRGEHPPGDEAGLREYAASLRTKTIAEAIGPARMLSGIDRFLFTESRLRHFERLETFPRGLLPIGDAICRFNPVWGQGISVAAIEGEALSEVLSAVAEGDGPLAGAWRPFFRHVAEIVEAPWALADIHRLAGEVQHQLQPRRALIEPSMLERIVGEMKS